MSMPCEVSETRPSVRVLHGTFGDLWSDEQPGLGHLTLCGTTTMQSPNHQIPMATRARQRTTHPSRRMVADEVWDPYHQEVRQLYLERQPPLSLEELMAYFRDTYAFIPTKKQWKDRLSKWKFQRNLDRGTAAVILHLLKEAETQDIPRRVFHNGHERSIRHIQQYIKKSQSFSNEEDLLCHLPEHESWPSSVTWIDDNPVLPVIPPQFEDRTGIFESPSTASGPYSFAFGGFAGFLPGSGSGIGFSGFDDFYGHHNQIMDHINRPTRVQPPRMARESSRRMGPVEQLQQEQLPDRFGEGPLSPESVGEQSTSDLHPAHRLYWDNPQESFSSLIGPFEPSASLQPASNNLLTTINQAASVTPTTSPPDTSPNEGDRQKMLAHSIDQMLGNAESLRDRPAKLFMRHCCEAMIHYGQGNQPSCAEAVQKATAAFQTLLTTSKDCYEMTIPTLNNMGVLLQAYGHRFVKRRILESLKPIAERADPQRRSVLLGSINFFLDTVDWTKDKITANKETIGKIYAAVLQTTDVDSPLAIAARYNEAWVLLEARETAGALSILQTEKNRCETVYGIYALQTITWNATQARAHEEAGEAVCSEALMNEVVLTRVEKAFSHDHPIYWEIKYRIGLFMLIFAKKNRLPARTEECWIKGEALLHETLVWRARELGPQNPQTVHAYTMLKRYLELQNKTRAAADLLRSYREEAGLPPP